MATILDKDIIRETTIKYEDREIQITLTADQQIDLKLKGMKSGTLRMGIEDLYKQLHGDNGKDEDTELEVKANVKTKPKGEKSINDPMISLHALRSLNAIACMSLATKVELEKLICELIKQDIKL